jgi:plastocyanin
MRRLLAVAWLVLVLSASASAGSHVAVAGTAPKAKVRCHWVKATKKVRRHKVCVKVKATKKTAKAAPTRVSAPAPPVAPVAPEVTVAAPLADPTPAPVVTTPPADEAPPAPAAARLQATAREFSLQLSRPTVTAGALILELINRGEDPHDLHVRPAAGGVDVLTIDRTEPTVVASATGTLPAGAYTLYCALPGHEAAGMRATLTVG